MGYLTLSRELLNSPFWINLSYAEKGMMLELITNATYKERLFNIHGYDVHLDVFDLCISLNSYAEATEIGRKKILNLLQRCERAELLVIKTVTVHKKEHEKGYGKGNGKSHDKISYKGPKKFTLLSFSPWVFGYDNSQEKAADKPDSEITAKETGKETGTDTQNKAIINKDSLKEKTKRKSACAELSFKGSQNTEIKKVWYTMEQIANLDVAYGSEIMADWKKFSGRSEKDIRNQLASFALKKKHLGLPEMTMDIFDKEFRKEMKAVFALKSKHKNEPVREPYYLFDKK